MREGGDVVGPEVGGEGVEGIELRGDVDRVIQRRDQERGLVEREPGLGALHEIGEALRGVHHPGA